MEVGGILKKISKRNITVNSIGTIGYLLQLFTWVLFVAVGMIILMESSVLTVFVPPNPIAPAADAQHMVMPAFFVGATYVLAILFGLAAIAVFLALPYLIGKWSSWVVRRMLALAKQLPTRRNMFLIKSVCTVIPLLGFLLLWVVVQPTDMTFSVIYVTAVIASTLALVCFVVQLFAARYLGVADKNLW